MSRYISDLALVIIVRLSRGLLCFLFAAGIIAILMHWFGIDQSLLSFPTNIIVIAGMLFSVYAIYLPPYQSLKVNYLNTWLFILGLVGFVPFVFMYDVFGTSDFGSLITVIRDNPPAEMLLVGATTMAEPIIEFSIIFIVLLFGGVYIAKYVPYFSKVIFTIGVVCILLSPVTSYVYRQVFPDPNHQLITTQDIFTIPNILTTPSIKKNVVFVYLESLERTYRTIPQTAGSFSTFAELEDQGLSFDNVAQIYGTHFTAAGMLATQCGVPLVQRGILSAHRLQPDEEFKNFMGHITCLGDILTEDGYVGSYINGSDLAIFNKGSLFKSHSYQRVFGVNKLKGTRQELYENSWGLSDASVFDYAHEELEYLVELDRPFLMSLLTIATHGPDAELDKFCEYPAGAESRIPAAIKCTGVHVLELLRKIEQLGIADETIVIILSDHLALKNTLDHLLGAHEEERRNLITIIGSRLHGVSSKLGSMIDIYPTVLEVMGYELEGGRANLGVSLISNQTTLSERFGVLKLSSAIKQNQPLQEFLWNEEVFHSRFSKSAGSKK